jgi:hypothetical protein
MGWRRKVALRCNHCNRQTVAHLMPGFVAEAVVASMSQQRTAGTLPPTDRRWMGAGSLGRASAGKPADTMPKHAASGIGPASAAPPHRAAMIGAQICASNSAPGTDPEPMSGAILSEGSNAASSISGRRVRLHEKAITAVSSDFLLYLIAAVRYKIHTILTDKGIQFTPPGAGGSAVLLIIGTIANGKLFYVHAFEFACAPGKTSSTAPPGPSTMIPVGVPGLSPYRGFLPVLFRPLDVPSLPKARRAALNREPADIIGSQRGTSPHRWNVSMNQLATTMGEAERVARYATNDMYVTYQT